MKVKKHKIRLTGVVEVIKEHLALYRQLHAETWPEVLAAIKEANFTNYSIHCQKINDCGYFLFSYMEYAGDNLAEDSKKLADKAVIQKWWSVCKPCLKPVNTTSIEQCWTPLEEVFYTE